MSIEKVGILGCGLMGAGIAQICAQAGFETVARDIEQRFIDTGFGIVEKNLTKAVEKGKISQQEKDGTWSRLKGTLELEDLKDCDLIIEAIIESLELKNDMF